MGSYRLIILFGLIAIGTAGPSVPPPLPPPPHNRTTTTSPPAASLNPTTIIVPRRLIEGSVEVIFLNVTDNLWRLVGSSGQEELETALNRFVVESYVVTSRNPRVAKILNSSLVSPTSSNLVLDDQQQQPRTDPTAAARWDEEEESWDENGVSALSVKISGRRVGKTVVDVSVYGFAALDSENDTAGQRFMQGGRGGVTATNPKELRLLMSFDVCVIRRSIFHRLSTAFTIFVAIITVVTTFLIGTQLDWRIIVKELKKPASLLIGLGFESVLMPLVAFVIALTILRGNYGWQLACLAIGACPGGGHSPFWTMMLDGNLDLAVAMSFVASVSALAVQPFWLFTLGRVFYGGRVTIPYTTISASLFGLICPIFVGLAFKHFLPRWAERIGRILKPVTVVSFIVVGIFGIGVNSYVFALLDWRHFVCGMLLPYAGYFITYPLARFLLRRTHADSLAIGIENGTLNVAVPVVLLQLSLTQPDADLSLVVPVGMVICASWPLWIYFVYLMVKKRFSTTKDNDHHEDGVEKSMEATIPTPTMKQSDSTTEMTTAASSSTISELSTDESHLSVKPDI